VRRNILPSHVDAEAVAATAQLPAQSLEMPALELVEQFA
jgi:hypothetical protein